MVLKIYPPPHTQIQILNFDGTEKKTNQAIYQSNYPTQQPLNPKSDPPVF